MAERAVATAKAQESKKTCSNSCKQKSSFNFSRSPADRILQLQRTAGNQAVQRLIKSGALQAKLKIGPPNDIYEQEAERVAEQVMRMPEPQAVSSGTLSVQRTCPRCEEEKLRREPIKEEEEKEELLQTKEISGQNAETTPDLESRINAIRGGGQPLAESERVFFEPRFGYDFGRVRVHADAKAAEAARVVNASAFTAGSNIVFGMGQYQPLSPTGKRLLAHELAHVIQQGHQLILSHHVLRKPSKSGILAEPPKHSYSRNCGWIDWGHTIPNQARIIIALVREASQRFKRTEVKIATTDAPEIVRESKCEVSREANEVSQSYTEQPAVKYLTKPSGTVEIRLGGFGVNSSDVTKFVPHLKALANAHTGYEVFKGNKYAIELSGFTDCVGKVRENLKLRSERSTVVLLSLVSAGKSKINVVSRAPELFLVSNNTREGRRQNRGVLIRLIPTIKPEQVALPPMESGGWGLVANRARLKASINRSLTEREILQVAFSLFARQSIAFEAVQLTTERIASSSFSEEDLPSNHISFYRAAYGYSLEEVRTICDAWDSRSSLAKFKGYKFQQNKTFYPLNLPPGGKWPMEFSTIQAIKPGTGDLYDIVEIFLQGPTDVLLGTGIKGK